MVLEVFGILIFSIIMGIVASYYLEKYLKPFEDNDVTKVDLEYDFQEDISNYNNDWNGYDYDRDCNISRKYEYDLGAENELSQEFESNHTEEDKD